jgi:hypothetical protein
MTTSQHSWDLVHIVESLLTDTTEYLLVRIVVICAFPKCLLKVISAKKEPFDGSSSIYLFFQKFKRDSLVANATRLINIFSILH